jgi:hypothetical protein
MNPSPSGKVRDDAVERCLALIAAHLERLAQGRDPMGRLFAIERLARAARADLRAARPGPDRRRP